MGILDKIEDKLSSNKHKNDPVVDSSHPQGSNVGQGAHFQQGNASNVTGPAASGGSGLGGPHSGPGVGSGITGGTAVGGGAQGVVPGSHPSAQNPSAIPTAGGATVGSGPGVNSVYDNTHDNRTFGEKTKDKMMPSRNDRPDDPVTGTNFNQSTPATHGMTGPSANTPLANDPGFNSRHTPGSGVTGTTHSGPGYNNNSNTFGSSNINDNRSFGEKAKDKLSNDRVDRPDDPITGQNYGQSGNTYGSGATSGVTGSHHTPGQTGYGTAGGMTGNNNLGSSNINDNRSFGEKAKDKLSNDRVDRPDDPITGQNYSQSGSNFSSHNTPGTTSGLNNNNHGTSGLTGNNTSSGPIGSSTYNSGTAPGVADNRSTMEKLKDKVVPSRSDRPDDPITGQNIDQTGGPNTTSAPGGPAGGVGGQRNW